MKINAVNMIGTDAQIAISKGDINAFAMIFKQYYSSLCRYAFGLVRDKDEAEEIVQRSFIKLWEQREGLHQVQTLEPFLFQMVRNSSLNYLKHEKVKQVHQQYQIAHAPIGTDAVMNQVLSQELNTRIQQALLQLPEQCGKVFKLSRFEGKSYAEIASEMAISVKTVENHMGKALKLMRIHLQEYLPIVFLLFSILI